MVERKGKTSLLDLYDIPDLLLEPLSRNLGIDSGIIKSNGELLKNLVEWRTSVLEKARAVVWIIQKLRKEYQAADDLEEKARRWAEIRRILIQDLKMFLAEQMNELGKSKIITGFFQIELNPGEPELEVDDIEKLPPDCVVRETPVYVTPRWSKIKRRLLKGKEVPGARLIPGSPEVVIK